MTIPSIGKASDMPRMASVRFWTAVVSKPTNATPKRPTFTSHNLSFLRVFQLLIGLLVLFAIGGFVVYVPESERLNKNGQNFLYIALSSYFSGQILTYQKTSEQCLASLGRTIATKSTRLRGAGDLIGLSGFEPIQALSERANYSNIWGVTSLERKARLRVSPACPSDLQAPRPLRGRLQQSRCRPGNR